MASPRHLANPPITEALIDLRVKAREGFDATAFLALKQRLAAEFPKAEERRGQQSYFELGPTQQLKPPVTKDLGLQGVFFRSADSLTVAQFRIDGFTLNRLRPYTSWQALLPQALRLWELYVETAKPIIVSRPGLRYINRVDLPIPVVFEEYFTSAPVIPPELPQETTSFLTKITIHDRERLLAASITQYLEANPATKPAVVMEIDAFLVEPVNPYTGAVAACLDALHEFKNRIFFSSVTEKTLEMFK